MSDAKLIRGQLRQIVKEELKSVMLAELKAEVTKEVTADMMKRLGALENLLREKLTVIDERSKDTMGLLVRQASIPNTLEK